MNSADEALRQGVRQNLSHWMKKLECDGDVERQQEFKRKFIQKLKQSVVAIETDTANEQHYEVPTEFYKTVLGKRLKYSCSQFPAKQTNLDEAEELALQQVCDRAVVKDGQTIMDLGCGWGSLGLYICEKYPGCKVTCVSNSATQRQHIESEADRRGYHTRLECITADANHFSTEKRYDRVISLEMFEHMRNYETLMSRVSRWLKPSGLLFTQILCHREFPYAFDTKRGADTEWMARNFFSGGTMPSADLFFYFQKDLYIMDHWKVNGVNYSKTLEAWLQKMDHNIEKVKAIFAEAYGKDAVDQQIFNWRLFFMFCSEVFGYEGGNEWMVSYHLFKKRPLSNL